MGKRWHCPRGKQSFAWKNTVKNHNYFQQASSPIQTIPHVARQMCRATRRKVRRAGAGQPSPGCSARSLGWKDHSAPLGRFNFSSDIHNKLTLLHSQSFLCHLEVLNQHLLIKFHILWGIFLILFLSNLSAIATSEITAKESLNRVV